MFHFIANLKDYTFHPGRGIKRFDAYLLSADYVGGQLDLAGKVIRDEKILSADNGNVDLIRKLIADWSDAAKELEPLTRPDTPDVHRYVRPGELSQQTVTRFAELAHRVQSDARSRIDDEYVKRAVTQQLSMNPSYLVGMEDLSTAALTGLSIEPEYSMLPVAFYRGVAERAIEYALETEAGAYGECPAPVYAGVHAMDFDTAYAVGQAVAQANASGIATGLAGAMMDKSWVDYRIEEGRVIEFERSVPRPYVRVMEIAAGMFEGFASRAGRRPAFHALGLGTPILLPLLSLMGGHDDFVAADSTAPIVDGWTAATISLYIEHPAPMKLKAHRIIEYWLSEDLAWNCECPYCRRILEKYPPDVAAAKRWWVERGRPRLTRSDVGYGKPLSEFIPILGNHSQLEIRSEAAEARVGHNHWIVQNIQDDARKHASSPARHRDWVSSIVERYLEICESASWREAAKQAWLVADATSKRLERSS